MYLYNVVVLLALTLCVKTLQGSMNIAGYGPRRTLVLDVDEQRYEPWEVK